MDNALATPRRKRITLGCGSPSVLRPHVFTTTPAPEPKLKVKSNLSSRDSALGDSLQSLTSIPETPEMGSLSLTDKLAQLKLNDGNGYDCHSNGYHSNRSSWLLTNESAVYNSLLPGNGTIQESAVYSQLFHSNRSHGDSGYNGDEDGRCHGNQGKPWYHEDFESLPQSDVSRKLSTLVPGKGQLNICIYENSGLLTVHVVQAKRLKSKWKALSDSYVKISLVPDMDRRSRCKTGLIRDTNNPSYDQKFSFELFPEDYKKRLLVSCWHRDDKNGRSEFLGCMSFGMKNLLSGKSQTDGWYYLLTEETGRRKHLQAPPERSYMRPASQYALRTSYIL